MIFLIKKKKIIKKKREKSPIKKRVTWEWLPKNQGKEETILKFKKPVQAGNYVFHVYNQEKKLVSESGIFEVDSDFDIFVQYIYKNHEILVVIKERVKNESISKSWVAIYHDQQTNPRKYISYAYLSHLVDDQNHICYLSYIFLLLLFFLFLFLFSFFICFQI